jgi:calcineurin-like phosphoesterase family protein
MKKIYITSDLHFGHVNVIDYCNRPYRDIDAMNTSFINKINSLDDGSILYHVGDWCMNPNRGIDAMMSIKKSIKVNIIKGNHDLFKNKHLTVIDSFDNINIIGDYKEIKSCGQKVVLFHFPILQWNKKQNGSIMLHGHSHGGCTYPNGTTRIKDVGIDCTDYEILTVEEHVEKLLLEPISGSFDNHNIREPI